VLHRKLIDEYKGFRGSRIDSVEAIDPSIQRLPTPIDDDHEGRPHVAPNADLRDHSFATGQATRLSVTTGRCIRPSSRSKLSSSVASGFPRTSACGSEKGLWAAVGPLGRPPGSAQTGSRPRRVESAEGPRWTQIVAWFSERFAF
jgi:hypothetical protein